MTKSYFVGRYNSQYFIRLCLNLLICSTAYGLPPPVVIFTIHNKNASLTKTNSTHQNTNTPHFGVSPKANRVAGFRVNLTTGSFSASQFQDYQNRSNRDTGFGSLYNKENSLDSARPSLWEIFKTSLFPNGQLKVENVPEHNANSIPQSQDYFKYNHLENSGGEGEENGKQDTLAWNPWEKIKSAASKSMLLSYLLGGEKSDLKQKSSTPRPTATSGDTERHSPLAESHDHYQEQQNRGKLIHGSLKTFLNIQNTFLNYVLGKHGQPLLKTTSVEPTHQPSLTELFLKPLSHLVSAHNSIDSHPPPVKHSKPTNDLHESPSEHHKVAWNAWHAYPWKESVKWDPWSYNYHIQRPATEGTILHFWKKLLWHALNTKKQIIKSKASILPLLVKIKINALRSVLEKIANKEKSPTFLLLRVIKNALWKGKKAFIKHFLKTKAHVHSFRSKLKYFKHIAPSPTPESSYGHGQDISDVHITYNSVPPSPVTEKYHSSIKPSWPFDSNSDSYQLLPPVVSDSDTHTYAETEHKIIATSKPATSTVFTSDYRASSSSLNPNFGEIIHVPLTSENTYSQPKSESHSRPIKTNGSFSSQLLQLRLKH